MLSVTTNSAALSAQRNLNTNSSNASDSIARMSSGSRIVKPSDDAASLAISNKLGASIAALEQAGRNASQGSSLLQVANGAYDNIGDMLSRMKVLATQVINGALSTTERLYAQEEFDGLREQITATAEQTAFGSVQLLNGGGGAYLSRGANATATVTDSTSNIAFSSVADENLDAVTATNYFAEASAEGISTGFVDGEVSGVSVEISGQAFEVSIQVGNQTFKGRFDASNNLSGDSITLTSTGNTANSINLVTAAAINSYTEEDRQNLESGMKAFFSGASYTAVNADPTAEVNGFTASGGTLGIDQNGTTVPVKAGAATAAGTYRLQYVSTGDETADGATGYSDAADERSGTGYFELTNGSDTWTVNQEDIQIVGEETNSGAYGIVTFGNGLQVYLDMGNGGAAASFDRGTSSSAAAFFEVAEGGGISLNFQVSDKATDQVTLNFASATASSLGLDGLSIADEDSAAAASARIDNAINVVNTAQASLGAMQSRFEYIESTIATTVENVTAAKGTFADVDMAAEMTDFTKSQTLMQASVAMLSQANQMPQQLLKLLS